MTSPLPAPAGETSRSALARAVLLVSGFALLALGALLLFLPGPGLPMLLGGLALLGKELPWARRVQQRILGWIERLSARLSWRRVPAPSGR